MLENDVLSGSVAHHFRRVSWAASITIGVHDDCVIGHRVSFKLLYYRVPCVRLLMKNNWFKAEIAYESDYLCQGKLVMPMYNKNLSSISFAFDFIYFTRVNWKEFFDLTMRALPRFSCTNTDMYA